VLNVGVRSAQFNVQKIVWVSNPGRSIIYASTNIIDNGSDNGQSDDANSGLDPEDNQQTLQQESATGLNSQQ